MGMNMSSMGMGFKGSMPQILNMVADKMYDQIVEHQDINDFEGFHRAILEIFSAINVALPGKHYDPPSLMDVTELFEKWEEKGNEQERRKALREFMKNKVNMNKADGSMIVTAIVAPPTAMVVKRTGQTLPQLKLMKSVPDVVFVPSFTVAALIAVKIMRYMVIGKTTTSKHAATPHVHDDQHEHKQEPAPQHEPEPRPPTAPAPAPTPAPAAESTPVNAAPGEELPKHAPPNFFCALCNRFH